MIKNIVKVEQWKEMSLVHPWSSVMVLQLNDLLWELTSLELGFCCFGIWWFPLLLVVVLWAPRGRESTGVKRAARSQRRSLLCCPVHSCTQCTITVWRGLSPNLGLGAPAIMLPWPWHWPQSREGRDSKNETAPRWNNICFSHLLAPTGALIVSVVYYI